VKTTYRRRRKLVLRIANLDRYADADEEKISRSEADQDVNGDDDDDDDDCGDKMRLESLHFTDWQETRAKLSCW